MLGFEPMAAGAVASRGFVMTILLAGFAQARTSATGVINKFIYLAGLAGIRVSAAALAALGVFPPSFKRVDKYAPLTRNDQWL